MVFAAALASIWTRRLILYQLCLQAKIETFSGLDSELKEPVPPSNVTRSPDL